MAAGMITTSLYLLTPVSMATGRFPGDVAHFGVGGGGKGASLVVSWGSGLGVQGNANLGRRQAWSMGWFWPEDPGWCRAGGPVWYWVGGLGWYQSGLVLGKGSKLVLGAHCMWSLCQMHSWAFVFGPHAPLVYPVGEQTASLCSGTRTTCRQHQQTKTGFEAL